MKNDGPILLLCASAGAGHITAACALEQSFRKQAPGVDVEVRDVLQAATAVFRTFYAAGYDAVVKYVPPLMGWLYDAFDRPRQGGRERFRTAFQSASLRRVRRYIVERRPRLIVNTHFLSAEVVAQLRNEGELACPQVTVITDFEAHRLWVQEPTERYYAPADPGVAALRAWGVEPERILVTGIPVRAAFEQTREPHELRRELDLDPEQPVILLVCGGCGAGLTQQWLESLARLRSAAQIVAITGRNTWLHARLQRFARGLPRRVRVIGFTDAMHAWMQAADLMVSKPGGLTVAEALVCGLPLVIVNPIPGQEVRNSDYMLEHGAAVKMNSPHLLGYRVDELLEDGIRLRRLRDNALAIARPGAADRIVADALTLLEKR